MPRGNIDNLRTPSTEEARKIGKKGGQKRGENLRMRKRLKEEILAMLEIKQRNGKSIQENWVTALVKNLLKGDVKTSIFVRDTIGEKPRELLELESNEISGIKIKFVDKSQRSNREERDPKIVGDYTPPINTEE